MRYPPSILEEIRARLPISTVVGRKVRLKKAGREWRGLSPFNAEKTPSFYVNDQKQFYHCFSSGKHGDIFSFLIETEGLSFPEAVERLAAEAGVSLPTYSPANEQEVRRRRDLYEVMEIACQYYEAQLQLAHAAAAREYLVTRQISVPTQAEFRFGFAPDTRSSLLKHLKEKGVDDDQILGAGLAIRPEDGRELYDRFRGRLMIPIQDRNGRVVAFGGRALAPDAKPKYLNSPETPLFKKGEMVFNAHRAREPAHRQSSIIVVEGYLDAIAVYQAGVKAVVATLGTAFTEEQIATLWRFAPEPVVCFDGDRAGRDAAFRALDRIVPVLKTGNSFRFAFLPEGEDPDDVIRSSGVERFRALVDGALPLWDVIWNRETAGFDFSTPDQQAALEKRVAELFAQIGDGRLRRWYELRARIHLSDLFWRARQAAGSRFGGRRKPQTDTALIRSTELLAGIPTRQVGLERIFLGLCVEYPDLAVDAYDRIMRVRMRGKYTADGESINHNGFIDALMDLLTNEEISAPSEIYRRLSPAFSGALEHLHGRETADLPMGHRLRSRFKVLTVFPPKAFIQRCFATFLSIFEVREMEDDLAGLLAEIEKSPADLDQKTEEHLLSLQKELIRTREWVNATELELAEEAGQYRYPSGVASAPLRLAA